MIFPAVPIIEKDGVKGLALSSRYPDLWSKVFSTFGKYGYVKVEITKPDSPATIKQNNAFHSLIGELWQSRLSSFSSYKAMKVFCKTCALTQCYDVLEVNGEIVNSVKSWSKFSKEQRSKAIDFTIKECINVGLNSAKFQEIMRGLEHGKDNC